MKVEVSNGELLDKLSILELKLKNIKDDKKLINIKNKSFSSFKFNFLGIFFISSQTKIKNGIKIPICFSVKINGYLR